MMTQTQVADGSLQRPWLGSQVYRWQAVSVANILRQHKEVREVLVFGSLARGQVGKDIDLILITDQDFAYDWINDTRACMEDFELAQVMDARFGFRSRNGAYHYKTLRRQAAGEILLGLNNLLGRKALLVQRDNLDIFVFPPDWRERLEELQEALPHADPMFMQNIARDAVRI